MQEDKIPEIASTFQQTDKTCENCGAAYKYDPASCSLLCEYCGTIKHIEEEDSVNEIDFDEAEQQGDHRWGENSKTAICKSCGAEAVYDALEISGVCAYCGSNQVMEASASDALAPNGVCGFIITAAQASLNFAKWIKRKWFTPKKAKESAKAEAFKGVYLPYWTFDTDTYSSYTAKYGIDRTYTDSKGRRTTKTSWYNTSGTYHQFIDDILIAGSERYDKTLTDRVEPFDTASSQPYKPEYLAGYSAERYSVGIKSAWNKAINRIKSILTTNIKRKITSQTGADRIANVKISTSYKDIRFKYLLLPVWLSSFSYKGKIFNFMVNGQTGKVGGRAPVSALRVLIAVLIGLGLLAFIYYIGTNSGSEYYY